MRMLARLWILMMSFHRLLPALRAWVMALAVVAMLLASALRSQAAELNPVVTARPPPRLGARQA